MIEKTIAYKKSDNEFIANLKKLGLSDKEIETILKKYGRKKFDDGGDGGGGDGGSDGGDGGDGGDSGGDSGGEGDSTGDAGDDGGTAGPGNAGMGEADTMGSSTADDAASNQAASEAAAQAAADEATVGMQQDPEVESPATGIMSQIGNLARQAFNTYTAFSPTAIAMNAISNAIANAQRGVTAPNDFSQATESVQSTSPATSNDGGGITTIQNYAPLFNTSTGDNTADAMRIRLNNLIQSQPTQNIYGIPTVSPYSNYTLLDLARRGLI